MSNFKVKSEGSYGNDSYPTKVGYYYVEAQFRALSGRILTFIDMSIPDARQNKAFKDIIKQEFYKRLSEVQSECSDGRAGHSVVLESTPIDPIA